MLKGVPLCRNLCDERRGEAQCWGGAIIWDPVWVSLSGSSLPPLIVFLPPFLSLFSHFLCFLSSLFLFPFFLSSVFLFFLSFFLSLAPSLPPSQTPNLLPLCLPSGSAMFWGDLGQRIALPLSEGFSAVLFNYPDKGRAPWKALPVLWGPLIIAVCGTVWPLCGALWCLLQTASLAFGRCVGVYWHKCAAGPKIFRLKERGYTHLQIVVLQTLNWSVCIAAAILANHTGAAYTPINHYAIYL